MRRTPILSLAARLGVNLGVALGAALAGTLPAAAAPPAFGDPAAVAAPGCPAPHPMGLRAAFPGEGPMGPPPGGHGIEPPLPPFLHGLTLSDEQQDRIFDLLHEQAPRVRQLARAAHKSHEQLHELGLSDKYDEAAAQALVDAATKAESELALIHTRTDHAIVALLTPEQRKRASARPEDGPRDFAGAAHAAPCWH